MFWNRSELKGLRSLYNSLHFLLKVCYCQTAVSIPLSADGIFAFEAPYTPSLETISRQQHHSLFEHRYRGKRYQLQVQLRFRELVLFDFELHKACRLRKYVGCLRCPSFPRHPQDCFPGSRSLSTLDVTKLETCYADKFKFEGSRHGVHKRGKSYSCRCCPRIFTVSPIKLMDLYGSFSIIDLVGNRVPQLSKQSFRKLRLRFRHTDLLCFLLF
mmetsp:Transcript_3081/g.5616  ORF Transcript_3081/g.5616 Transcript_3081/m.5616 type:complete len:214 (-) Transcript_3081:66-707(-)